MIPITRIYYYPYHPIHKINAYKHDSPDRKPKPKILLRAHTDFNLDLTSSALVGDKLSDIQAAEAAGVGTRILLRSAAELDPPASPCHVADSLDDIRDRFFSRGALSDHRGGDR